MKHTAPKYLSALTNLNSSETLIGLGLMSGTSADGVDAAVVEFSKSEIKLLHLESAKYPKELREKVLKSKNSSIKEISALNVEIGNFFAETALSASKVVNKKIDFIGSHGQTIFHHNGNESTKSTFQIGCADTIAERLGTFVVSDFRTRDIAAGGEGAPLTPYADKRFFGDSPKVIVNIGGISNLTILGEKEILGFDCGPGNAPLDRLSHLLTEGKQEFDRDGALAASGLIEEAILKELKENDLFVKKSPPKSTGTEVYGDQFVKRLIELNGGVSASLLSTVTEFVAWCIGMACSQQDISPDIPILLAGGGSQNSYLRSRISEHVSPRPLFLTDDFGIPWQARESMAFALFAYDLLLGKNTSLPSVTGASHSAPLGKISLPRSV